MSSKPLLTVGEAGVINIGEIHVTASIFDSHPAIHLVSDALEIHALDKVLEIAQREPGCAVLLLAPSPENITFVTANTPVTTPVVVLYSDRFVDMYDPSRMKPGLDPFALAVRNAAQGNAPPFQPLGERVYMFTTAGFVNPLPLNFRFCVAYDVSVWQSVPHLTKSQYELVALRHNIDTHPLGDPAVWAFPWYHVYPMPHTLLFEARNEETIQRDCTHNAQELSYEFSINRAGTPPVDYVTIRMYTQTKTGTDGTNTQKVYIDKLYDWSHSATERVVFLPQETNEHGFMWPRDTSGASCLPCSSFISTPTLEGSNGLMRLQKNSFALQRVDDRPSPYPPGSQRYTYVPSLAANLPQNKRGFIAVPTSAYYSVTQFLIARQGTMIDQTFLQSMRSAMDLEAIDIRNELARAALTETAFKPVNEAFNNTRARIAIDTITAPTVFSLDKCYQHVTTPEVFLAMFVAALIEVEGAVGVSKKTSLTRYINSDSGIIDSLRDFSVSNHMASMDKLIRTYANTGKSIGAGIKLTDTFPFSFIRSAGVKDYVDIRRGMFRPLPHMRHIASRPCIAEPPVPAWPFPPCTEPPSYHDGVRVKPLPAYDLLSYPGDALGEEYHLDVLGFVARLASALEFPYTAFTGVHSPVTPAKNMFWEAALIVRRPHRFLYIGSAEAGRKRCRYLLSAYSPHTYFHYIDPAVDTCRLVGEAKYDAVYCDVWDPSLTAKENFILNAEYVSEYILTVGGKVAGSYAFKYHAPDDTRNSRRYLCADLYSLWPGNAARIVVCPYSASSALEFRVTNLPVDGESFMNRVMTRRKQLLINRQLSNQHGAPGPDHELAIACFKHMPELLSVFPGFAGNAVPAVANSSDFVEMLRVSFAVTIPRAGVSTLEHEELFCNMGLRFFESHPEVKGVPPDVIATIKSRLMGYKYNNHLKRSSECVFMNAAAGTCKSTLGRFICPRASTLVITGLTQNVTDWVKHGYKAMTGQHTGLVFTASDDATGFTSKRYKYLILDEVSQYWPLLPYYLSLGLVTYVLGDDDELARRFQTSWSPRDKAEGELFGDVATAKRMAYAVMPLWRSNSSWRITPEYGECITRTTGCLIRGCSRKAFICDVLDATRPKIPADPDLPIITMTKSQRVVHSGRDAKTATERQGSDMRTCLIDLRSESELPYARSGVWAELYVAFSRVSELLLVIPNPNVDFTPIESPARGCDPDRHYAEDDALEASEYESCALVCSTHYTAVPSSRFSFEQLEQVCETAESLVNLVGHVVNHATATVTRVTSAYEKMCAHMCSPEAYQRIIQLTEAYVLEENVLGIFPEDLPYFTEVFGLLHAGLASGFPDQRPRETPVPIPTPPMLKFIDAIYRESKRVSTVFGTCPPRDAVRSLARNLRKIGELSTNLRSLPRLLKEEELSLRELLDRFDLNDEEQYMQYRLFADAFAAELPSEYLDDDTNCYNEPTRHHLNDLALRDDFDDDAELWYGAVVPNHVVDHCTHHAIFKPTSLALRLALRTEPPSYNRDEFERYLDDLPMPFIVRYVKQHTATFSQGAEAVHRSAILEGKSWDDAMRLLVVFAPDGRAHVSRVDFGNRRELTLRNVSIAGPIEIPKLNQYFTSDMRLTPQYQSKLRASGLDASLMQFRTPSKSLIRTGPLDPHLVHANLDTVVVQYNSTSATAENGEAGRVLAQGAACASAAYSESAEIPCVVLKTPAFERCRARDLDDQMATGQFNHLHMELASALITSCLTTRHDEIENEILTGYVGIMDKDKLLTSNLHGLRISPEALLPPKEIIVNQMPVADPARHHRGGHVFTASAAHARYATQGYQRTLNAMSPAKQAAARVAGRSKIDALFTNQKHRFKVQGTVDLSDLLVKHTAGLLQTQSLKGNSGVPVLLTGFDEAINMLSLGVKQQMKVPDKFGKSPFENKAHQPIQVMPGSWMHAYAPLCRMLFGLLNETLPDGVYMVGKGLSPEHIADDVRRRFGDKVDWSRMQGWDISECDSSHTEFVYYYLRKVIHHCFPGEIAQRLLHLLSLFETLHAHWSCSDREHFTTANADELYILGSGKPFTFFINCWWNYLTVCLWFFRCLLVPVVMLIAGDDGGAFIPNYIPITADFFADFMVRLKFAFDPQALIFCHMACNQDGAFMHPVRSLAKFCCRARRDLDLAVISAEQQGLNDQWFQARSAAYKAKIVRAWSGIDTLTPERVELAIDLLLRICNTPARKIAAMHLVKTTRTINITDIAGLLPHCTPFSAVSASAPRTYTPCPTPAPPRSWSQRQPYTLTCPRSLTGVRKIENNNFQLKKRRMSSCDDEYQAEIDHLFQELGISDDEEQVVGAALGAAKILTKNRQVRSLAKKAVPKATSAARKSRVPKPSTNVGSVGPQKERINNPPPRPGTLVAPMTSVALHSGVEIHLTSEGMLTRGRGNKYALTGNVLLMRYNPGNYAPGIPQSQRRLMTEITLPVMVDTGCPKCKVWVPQAYGTPTHAYQNEPPFAVAPTGVEGWLAWDHPLVVIGRNAFPSLERPWRAGLCFDTGSNFNAVSEAHAVDMVPGPTYTHLVNGKRTTTTLYRSPNADGLTYALDTSLAGHERLISCNIVSDFCDTRTLKRFSARSTPTGFALKAYDPVRRVSHELPTSLRSLVRSFHRKAVHRLEHESSGGEKSSQLDESHVRMLRPVGALRPVTEHPAGLTCGDLLTATPSGKYRHFNNDGGVTVVACETGEPYVGRDAVLGLCMRVISDLRVLEGAVRGFGYIRACIEGVNVTCLTESDLMFAELAKLRITSFNNHVNDPTRVAHLLELWNLEDFGVSGDDDYCYTQNSSAERDCEQYRFEQELLFCTRSYQSPLERGFQELGNVPLPCALDSNLDDDYCYSQMISGSNMFDASVSERLSQILVDSGMGESAAADLIDWGRRVLYPLTKSAQNPLPSGLSRVAALVSLVVTEASSYNSTNTYFGIMTLPNVRTQTLTLSDTAVGTSASHYRFANLRAYEDGLAPTAEYKNRVDPKFSIRAVGFISAGSSITNPIPISSCFNEEGSSFHALATLRNAGSRVGTVVPTPGFTYQSVPSGTLVMPCGAGDQINCNVAGSAAIAVGGSMTIRCEVVTTDATGTATTTGATVVITGPLEGSFGARCAVTTPVASVGFVAVNLRISAVTASLNYQLNSFVGNHFPNSPIAASRAALPFGYWGVIPATCASDVISSPVITTDYSAVSAGHLITCTAATLIAAGTLVSAVLPVGDPGLMFGCDPSNLEQQFGSRSSHVLEGTYAVAPALSIREAQNVNASFNFDRPYCIALSETQGAGSIPFRVQSGFTFDLQTLKQILGPVNAKYDPTVYSSLLGMFAGESIVTSNPGHSKRLTAYLAQLAVKLRAKADKAERNPNFRTPRGKMRGRGATMNERWGTQQ